jgi:hypothetical protein
MINGKRLLLALMRIAFRQCNYLHGIREALLEICCRGNVVRKIVK